MTFDKWWAEFDPANLLGELKNVARTSWNAARSSMLSPAEIECLEVYADGSISLLGDYSQSVMSKMMMDIAKRAKS